jgi:hypothetical protein
MAHDVVQRSLEDARMQVQLLFAAADALTPREVELLWRAERRAGVRSLATEPAFLQAVASGAWSPAHAALSREIHVWAAARAARLTDWRRRRVVARALANAAHATLSDHDRERPLVELADRLRQPWSSALAALVPTQRRPREQGPQ